MMLKLLTFILFFQVFVVHAQITITRIDMPRANDTIYMGTVNFYSGSTFTASGPNQTWDFSTLTTTGQRLDSFVSIGSTSILYQLFFNNPLPPYNENRSTVALRVADIPLPAAFPVQFTDVLAFYKNPNDPVIPFLNPNPARLFAQTGFGATVSSLPLSVAYKAAKDMDILYKFPLNYLNTDSCESEWDLSLPIIGFIAENRKRKNLVDAWGSIITPVGTFSCLRVKSISAITDTLKLADSLLPIPIPGIKVTRYETEYKWIAAGKRLPLVKAVYTSLIPGVQGLLSSIEFQKYKDTPATINSIVKLKDANVAINYNSDEHSLFLINNNGKTVNLLITDMLGKIVFKEDNISGGKKIQLNNMPQQMLLARLTIDSKQQIVKFVTAQH